MTEVEGGAGEFREKARDIISLYPPAGAVIGVARKMEGQQGQRGQQQGPPSESWWDASTRRQETAIRGPIDKEATSMTRYIVIAVVIISILLIWYGIGRKWEAAPTYQSVFNAFTVTRPVIPGENKSVAPMMSNSARLFGVMPTQPMHVRV